jgi:hypothetical protein
MRRKYHLFPLVLLLAAGIPYARQAQRQPPRRAETPYERLGRVTKWDVTLHIVYDHQDAGWVNHAVSDWTGTLDNTDWSSSEVYRGWYGSLNVRFDGYDRNRDCECTLTGSEKKYSPDFRIYATGIYEMSWGAVSTDLHCPMHCSYQPNNGFSSIGLAHDYVLKKPLPTQGMVLAGSDTATIGSGETIAITWNLRPAGTKPQLEALPNVAPSVVRGQPLTLDGSQSTGDIKSYKWTFKLSGTSASEPPDPNAEKHGAQTTVVLLDSMTVTLEVSDGQKTDKKTVSVTVTPRKEFRTTFEIAMDEGTLPDSSPPSCRVAGTAPNGEQEYAGGWTGGENACAFDPPRSSSEPAHIFHPNPENSAKDEQYTLVKVNDPGGPWDGFSYFDAWKLKIKRMTLLNRYVLPGAPPVFRGMTKNFYQMNVEMGNDVAGYLQAVRQHEKQHSDLMQQALAASDPARDTEKAYGKDEVKLRREVDDRIREAAKRLHSRAKDPLAEIWHGNLAVPQDDTYQWRTFMQHVGGNYTLDF